MKEIVNPWVIAGSVFLAAGLLAGIFFAAGFVEDPGLNDFGGEAALTIIPNPTRTPTLTPTLSPVTVTPTAAARIQVGGYVQIIGTGGEGLRLRQDPSLNSKVDYLGMEDEIFLVADGPVEQDGYLWWFLQAPANQSRQGWGAANFMQVAQNP